jgi:hypothetical protein
MTDLSQLDDQTAQRILTIIARARSRDTQQDSPTLRAALAREFDVTPATATEGDLARQALLVLAEDPATRLAIESIAKEEPTGHQTYDPGASIGLALAAYFALSTAVDLQYKDGKWSFKLKVKPAGEAAVKKLVEKIVGYLPA